MSSGSETEDRRRWAELKSLFNAAVEGPREDWPSVVSDVRTRDAALADQLQRLLDGHAESLIHITPPRPEHLEPGDTLGPYVITGLIGEGGMGQIYRARDERLGRDVAIKVLPPYLADDPGRRARIEREARAMGMLNHPNIVMVYDFGDHHGALFIVSELLEGRTLREQMAAGAGSGSGLEARAAVEIVACVGDALGAAHRRGIVHRDIKPENIFVTSDGRIKVLDFGIAKLLEGDAGHATAVATMVGTLGYMAPEQYRSEPVGAPTDVYASGVVLYELLSGARPFAGRSQAALFAAIQQEQPPPLTGVAPALSALVTRCLAKHPEARFADGAQLAAALRALTTFETATGHVRRERTSPKLQAVPQNADRPTRETASRRWMLVASILVLLTSLGLGTLVWWQPPDHRTPEPPLVAAHTDSAPPTVEPGSPQPQPAVPPPLVVPTLNGIWTVNEQMTEDVHAIDCTASGALQLKFDDGLLDGTLRLKRECRDVKRSTTDSTETMAALTASTVAGDVVSFMTRTVDGDVATTCRYSGRIVGSSRGTMTGEVTCDARAAGLSSVLALRGNWRASRP